MKWLDKRVSLYNYNRDNIGRNEYTLRDIIFTKFAVPHSINGKEYNDLETVVKLRGLEKTSSDYNVIKNSLKNTLQGFTPAALLKTREKDRVVEIERTGLAQLDFDGKDNPAWDMENLKEAVFQYPFIAFCGKSCSGNGFYALTAIAEPDMLKEYAEQMFAVFKKFNINVDTTKGRNPQDLRYVSYDSRMLFREDPEPLKINSFFKSKTFTQESANFKNPQTIGNPDKIAEYWLRKLRSCSQGNRMNTIADVARALGSKRLEEYRNLMLNEIRSNSVFEDQREQFLKEASKLFKWGWNNPLRVDMQA